VDREAMARRQRRRQVEEALDDERAREAALAERLEEVVVETEGPTIDTQVFERLDPEDVEVVRAALGTRSPFDEEEERYEDDPEAFLFSFDGDGSNGTDEEIARLQDQIAGSQRRQQALQRYLDALDG
jgi:hypothetical protein